MPPLQIQYISDGKWKLNSDLHYVHPELGMIVVPAGTTTDLDSVPRMPLAYMLAKNRTVIGATVHDYLYATGKLHGKPITRALADKIFLQAMKDEGVGWFARRVIYLGVRAGGLLAWRRHRKND